MSGSTRQPTSFLDYDHPAVQSFAAQAVADLPPEREVERVQALFLAVRDGFVYDPYRLDLRPEALKASRIVTKSHSYCVEKAVLLAASLRAQGFASRLFFGNVRNHIGTGRLEAFLGTNVLAFHGAAEVYLHQRWIKLTPAFNRELCEKLGVHPLEFDGVHDAVFQEFAPGGDRFMEYLVEHGSFDDLPYALYLEELHRHYGQKFASLGTLVFDFSGV